MRHNFIDIIYIFLDNLFITSIVIMSTLLLKKMAI